MNFGPFRHAYCILFWYICPVFIFVIVFARKTIFITILRLLIGAFFIATAVMKLFSLQSFEIYIYSFNLFNFVMSTFVARAVIAAELLLGALLISKILYKPAWWLTQLMLLGFTMLLAYTAIFRHDTNCHCMGDIVQMSPSWSIVKNVIVMLLLLLVRKESDYTFKGKVAVGIALLVAALGVPYALYPMDAIYNRFEKGDTAWNAAQFDLLMQDSLVQPLHLEKGKHLLGFLSSECGFCQNSAVKLHNIFVNNQLDSTAIQMFIFGSTTSVQHFQESTETEGYSYVLVDPYVAIAITQGAFPVYVLLQDGKVQQVLNVRELDDKTVVQFFK